jgi:hypothetical protein
MVFLPLAADSQFYVSFCSAAIGLVKLQTNLTRFARQRQLKWSGFDVRYPFAAISFCERQMAGHFRQPQLSAAASRFLNPVFTVTRKSPFGGQTTCAAFDCLSLGTRGETEGAGMAPE